MLKTPDGRPWFTVVRDANELKLHMRKGHNCLALKENNSINLMNENVISNYCRKLISTI